VRLWTVQGHDAFENTQGHGGGYCPPLLQAMSIKNKRVLWMGVPTLQDLQQWTERSQSIEEFKLLTIGTFEAAAQWLAERSFVRWDETSDGTYYQH